MESKASDAADDLQLVSPQWQSLDAHARHGHHFYCCAYSLNLVIICVRYTLKVSLGYKPELQREMNLFTNFAVSFSIISILMGITGANSA
jgi:hypothetical protein